MTACRAFQTGLVTLRIADIDDHDKRNAGMVLGVVAKSIGSALGLRKETAAGLPAPALGPVDCAAQARRILGDRR